MKNITDFFSKWAFVIVLGIIGIALLFAIGCCAYTAITNPTVGIIGAGIDIIILAFVVGWMCVEIKGGKE